MKIDRPIKTPKLSFLASKSVPADQYNSRRCLAFGNPSHFSFSFFEIGPVLFAIGGKVRRRGGGETLEAEAMEPETATAAAPPEEGEAVVAAGTDEEARKEVEEEMLVARAQRLISKITATQANPNPRLIHALASMLEAQESRSCSVFMIAFLLFALNSVLGFVSVFLDSCVGAGTPLWGC